MIIAMHQPNYLPWGGYFYKLLASDYFIFLDDDQYSKNKYVNRTQIIYDQKYSWLTIPVNFKLGETINEVKFAQPDWGQRHLSKIKNAYQKAPYFYENWDDLYKLYQKRIYLNK